MGRRVFNFILLAVMIVGAVVTYEMKHKAEVAADNVARLEADIGKEKDALSLLKAEWSVLTQPGRLQGVVEKYADHFRLESFSAAQIATIGEIPLRPVGDVGTASETIASIAASESGDFE